MTLKKKIIVVTLIPFAILALMLYFIILPSIKDIQKINKAIEAEKRELVLKFHRGQYLKVAKQNFEEVEEQRDKLEVIFIPEGEELIFIERLEQIAESQNINLTITVNQKKIIKNNNVTALPIQLKMNGDYIQILKYLYTIEKLIFYFDVSSIDISGQVLANKHVTATMQGVIYSKINPMKIAEDDEDDE